MVHLAKKLSRLEILSTAVLIGKPLARFPAIVEIEHGGNSIDPNSINVVFVEPEESVCD